MPQPGVYNLDVYQGDTKKFKVIVKSGPDGGPFTVVDLTGCTAAAQIRDTVTAASAAATFACTVSNPTGGEVSLVLSAADSALLSPSIKVWDLQITWPSGDKFTYLKGNVTITGEVTRG